MSSSPKDMLSEYDRLFLKSCEDAGLDRKVSVSALLSDSTRIQMLEAMVKAEQTKTRVVIQVDNNEHLQQMFMDAKYGKDEE